MGLDQPVLLACAIEYDNATKLPSDTSPFGPSQIMVMNQLSQFQPDHQMAAEGICNVLQNQQHQSVWPMENPFPFGDEATLQQLQFMLNNGVIPQPLMSPDPMPVLSHSPPNPALFTNAYPPSIALDLVPHQLMYVDEMPQNAVPPPFGNPSSNSFNQPPAYDHMPNDSRQWVLGKQPVMPDYQPQTDPVHTDSVIVAPMIEPQVDSEPTNAIVVVNPSNSRSITPPTKKKKKEKLKLKEKPSFIVERPVNMIIHFSDTSDDEISPRLKRQTAIPSGGKVEALQSAIDKLSKMIQAKEQSRKTSNKPSGAATPVNNTEYSGSVILATENDTNGPVVTENPPVNAAGHVEKGPADVTQSLDLLKASLKADESQLEASVKALEKTNLVSATCKHQILNVQRYIEEEEQKQNEYRESISSLKKQKDDIMSKIKEMTEKCTALDSEIVRIELETSKSTGILNDKVKERRTLEAKLESFNSAISSSTLKINKMKESIESRLAALSAKEPKPKNNDTPKSSHKRVHSTDLSLYDQNHPKKYKPAKMDDVKIKPEGAADSEECTASATSYIPILPSPSQSVSSASSHRPNIDTTSFERRVQDTILPFFQFSSSFIQTEHELGLPSQVCTDHNIPIEEQTIVVEQESPVEVVQPSTSTGFKPYKSVLGQFPSLMLHSEYNPEDSLRSLKWSSKLNPSKEFCKYELEGGKCSDTTCKNQHFKDLSMSDDEILENLIESSGSMLSKESMAKLMAEINRLRDALKSKNIIISAVIAFLKAHNPSTLDKNLFASLENKAASTSNKLEGGVPLPTKLELPPRIPILNLGIRRLMRGEKVQQSRYYSLQSKEFESRFQGPESKNPELWISYALSKLDANQKSIQSMNFAEAVNVLKRGLSSSPKSECVWMLYLDMHQHNADKREMRSIFKRAISSYPTYVDFWWRLVVFESDPADKLNALERMLVHLCSDVCSTMTSRTRSHALLNCIVQICQQLILLKDVEKAEFVLEQVIRSRGLEGCVRDGSIVVPNLRNYVIAHHLDPQNRSLLALLAAHLAFFKYLPSSAFYEYPHTFLLNGQPFLINWNHPSGNRSHKTVAKVSQIFTYWKGQFRRPKDLIAHEVSVARNYSTFMMLVAKQSVAAVFDCMNRIFINFSSSLLRYQLFAIKEEAIPVENIFKHITVTNLACRSVLKKQSDAAKAQAIRYLVNCIRRCYGNIEPINGIIPESESLHGLELYKYALAISSSLPHTDGPLQPVLKSGLSGKLRDNLQLWLNFIMLHSLLDGKDHLALFQKALSSIDNTASCGIIWMELLRFITNSSHSNKYDVLTKQLSNALSYVQRKHVVLKHPEENDFSTSLPIIFDVWSEKFVDHLFAVLPLNVAIQRYTDIESPTCINPSPKYVYL